MHAVISYLVPLRLTGPKLKEILTPLGKDVELDCDIEAFPTPKWTFEYGKSGGIISCHSWITLFHGRGGRSNPNVILTLSL